MDTEHNNKTQKNNDSLCTGVEVAPSEHIQIHPTSIPKSSMSSSSSKINIIFIKRQILIKF